jgi:uncharacterized pyridoxamine 5'-phosphate oxidase family protein
MARSKSSNDDIFSGRVTQRNIPVSSLVPSTPAGKLSSINFTIRSLCLLYPDRTVKVCQQLRKNPLVEVCFSSESHDKIMRVAGEVEFLDDAGLRARLIEERPFLKAIVQGPQDPNLAVFRMHHGEARFWTMEFNMREGEAPRASF